MLSAQTALNSGNNLPAKQGETRVEESGEDFRKRISLDITFLEDLKVFRKSLRFLQVSQL